MIIRQKRQSESRNIKKMANMVIDSVRALEKEMVEAMNSALTEKKDELIREAGFEKLIEKKSEFEEDFSKMEKGITDLLKMENIEEYLDFVDENNPKSYLNQEG